MFSVFLLTAIVYIFSVFGSRIFERRLAAILATDVVGYSRFMGADETGTLAAFGQFRAKLFAPAAAIADPHGRIVKLMCDGGLVECFE